MSLRQCPWMGVLCAALAGLCGCSQARLVTRDAEGGVVAIPANTNSWPCYYRNHAEELMKQESPGGYVVTKEEEVVVGTTQHTQVNTERQGDNVLAALHIAPVTEHTNQTTSYVDSKEWRISFHKKDAPPATGPSAP
jgi:hypothetical protein